MFLQRIDSHKALGKSAERHYSIGNSAEDVRLENRTVASAGFKLGQKFRIREKRKEQVKPEFKFLNEFLFSRSQNGDSRRADGGVRLPVNVASDFDTGGRCVRTAEVLIRYPTCLTKSGQERSVHRGRVVADGVLAGEEDSRRVLDHVVVLARVARNDGAGQDVGVAAGCPNSHEGVRASRPRICSPPIDKNAEIFKPT